MDRSNHRLPLRAQCVRLLRDEQLPQRVLLYVFALFLMSLGVVFNVNANLGVSPIAVLPFTASLITGLTLGTSAFLIFSLFTLAQVLILRREFQWIQLSQVFVSRLVGYFVDFLNMLLGDFQIPGYGGQLVMLAIGILFVACGVALHMKARLVTLPPAALVAAIAKKLRSQFHKVKVVVDCSFVATASVLSLVFLGDVVGIREGTVLSAILMGRLIPYINRVAAPALRTLGFRTIE